MTAAPHIARTESDYDAARINKATPVADQPNGYIADRPSLMQKLIAWANRPPKNMRTLVTIFGCYLAFVTAVLLNLAFSSNTGKSATDTAFTSLPSQTSPSIPNDPTGGATINPHPYSVPNTVPVPAETLTVCTVSHQYDYTSGYRRIVGDVLGTSDGFSVFASTDVLSRTSTSIVRNDRVQLNRDSSGVLTSITVLPDESDYSSCSPLYPNSGGPGA
jgi:hypothetical protein